MDEKINSMKEEKEANIFELTQKMKDRNIIRLSKLFYMNLAERVEAKVAEHGFPEMKVHYFGFLANLQPGGTTSRDLANRLKVTKQAISKMTQEIEQLGFIEFFPHETDGRCSLIRLTKKGVSMLQAGLLVSEEIKADLETKIGKASMDHLVSTLKILVE